MFDTDVAITEFKRRYAENVGKQIDNSSLHAGSPMYYYCDGCCILIDTRPEGWFGSRPDKYCVACNALAEHGVIDRAVQEARNAGLSSV